MVTLTTNDLQRMLASPPDTSAEHLAAVKHDSEERRMQERAASKARKEKMLKLEEEARKQVCMAPCTWKFNASSSLALIPQFDQLGRKA